MRIVCLIVATGCGFSTTLDPTAAAGPDSAAVQPTSCDLDDDGACDDQTWRCSPAASGVAENPLFGDVNNEALWAHDVSLANKGRYVVVAPGKPIRLALRYDWRVDCPSNSNCQAQVEYGLVATGMDDRQGCLVDRQMPDRDVQWNQNATTTLVTPTTPGVYDVRLEIAKRAACGTSWSTPAGNRTIAKICVP